MSGIFLIVDGSKLLQNTTGGYPHITLAYTAKSLEVYQLTNLIPYISDLIMLKVRVVDIKVNSFEYNDKMRHDVLFMIDSNTGHLVDEKRTLITGIYPDGKYIMREPHITHSNHETEESANETLAKLKNELPFTCQITGITIA